MKANRLPFLFVVTVSFLFGGIEMPVSQAQKMKDSTKYYYHLMRNPQESTDLTQAYQYYQRYLQHNLTKKDTVAAINDLRYMASIQNNLGLFYDSEKTVVQALKLLDQQQRKDSTYAAIGLYNQLGMIHRSLYNYAKSIEFYEKALSVSQNGMDSITILNNIAHVHSEEGKYDLASNQFTSIYRNSIKLKDTASIARALDNLGFTKTKLHNPSGLEDMKEALLLRKSLNDSKGLYSSHKHLSEYYHQQHKRDSATYYAEEAYKLAKSINSLSFIEDALSNLMLLTEDPQVLEYKTITDSIAKTNQLQENKFAEMQYNFSDYQRKAQESQLAASEQRTKTLAYQFVGLSILLMAIFFYILLRGRHKKENQLKVYETETRISKKVHDEVANDIFQMMTKIQTNPINSEPLLDELEHIYVKTRDISKENSDIIHTDFNIQLQDLLSSYQSDDVNIITKNLQDVEWDSVSDMRKTTLYRVLQELMTNMKKHSKATLVAITFQQEKKKLFIIYKDNGIGTDLHKGSGCQNMEHRMASIKGIIIFESSPNNGFKASLTV